MVTARDDGGASGAPPEAATLAQAKVDGAARRRGEAMKVRPLPHAALPRAGGGVRVARGPLTIFDLKEDTCKFGLWDHRQRLDVSGMFFCGAPCVRGRPWCAPHIAIVFSGEGPRPPRHAPPRWAGR
jgi:hypothetical protein